MTSGSLLRAFVSAFPVARKLFLQVCAFAVIALVGGRAFAQQVVISQIYGGSNATGATYNRDYVELHNRGGSPVSLVGWSIQVATSTGSTWTRTNLTSGSIAAGGYFLIQMTTSGTIGAALPTPDFSATTANDIATGSGKVALVTNQTTLPGGGAFQLGSNGIADFVGFGQTGPAVGPNGYEGNGGTPGAGTVALAIYRANNGCTDTHNNATDFLAPALPVARNSASPVFNCTPTGACCNGTSCSYVDSGSCTGTYQGDFSLCGVVAYPTPATTANAFDDISGTGTALALDNSDDGQVTVAIAPAFTFFGNSRSQVSVGVNGLLTFLPGTTATSFSNVAIPAVTTPNDMVAALWMDLFTRTTLIPNAHIYTQQKTAPNRFIVQWNQVSTRASTTVTPDNMTFQVILNQDTSTIEYRYAAMNTTGTTPAYAASTGIEDQSGTLGSSFAGGSFAALANTSRQFTPGGQSTCSPPINDNCAGASVIPGAGTGPAGVSGLNTLATLDGAATACGVPCDKDVWFAFQPTFTNNWVISTCPNAAQDTVLEVYDACGGSVIACDDDGCALQSTVTLALSSASSYRIRVASKGAGAAGGAYTLVVVQQPPANDVCSGAAVIGSVPYVAGTSDCNGLAATDDLDITCNSGTVANRGVWFTITPAISGNLNWSETSANDTSVAVFSGTCGTLTQIACSDPEAAFVAVTAGTQYWIMVSMFSSTAVPTVPYGLSVDVIPPLANDTCAGATALAIPSVTFGTTVTATAETPAPPACAGPLPGGSQSYTIGTSPGVWYSVTSPTNQTITADTLASAYDSRIWIYNASGGCGALVCVTANDDAQGSPFQSRAAWQAIAGVPYYILVAPFSSTTGAFTLTISADPTPSNDDCAGATLISGSVGSIGGTTIGSTAINNTSTAANPSCNPSYSMFEVWYAWTAPCSGSVTFATCGTYDTLLSLHTACSTLTLSNQVASACNDNGPAGCTPGSSLTATVVGGTSYRIRVAASNSAIPMGNFTLTWAQVDGDGDGTFDGCDGCPTDPLKTAPGICGCGVPDTDSDGDGTANCLDGCPLDPLKIAAGQCGCGVPDTDSDGDGVANCLDGCPNDPLKIAPGICGCNLPDTDSDGDGTADCIDGCPSDPLKILPGICGCNIPDTDSDGDGTPNCNDQCPNDPLKVLPGICGCGVSDTTNPNIISCAPDLAGSANSTCSAPVPDFTALVVATDDCGPLVITQLPVAGTLVGLGQTPVQITVTDQAGNFSTCTANFNVSDTTPPVVTSGSIASCYSTVAAAQAAALAATSATDNCTGILGSPSVGTVGTCNAQVTVTYTDGAGNPGSAVYSTSIDATNPTITCPGDVTVFGTGPTFVTVPPPVTGDNCGVASVVNSFNGTGNASGTYPLGTTPVVWTVTDNCGNVAQCSMNVNVTLGLPQVKISQIFGGGALTGSVYTRDYVELYNAGGAPAVMSNWALQLTTSTGTAWTVINLNGTINPGQYFLVGLTSSTTYQSPALPTVDASGTFDLSATSTQGSKLAVTNNNTALTGSNPISTAIQDFLGYGTGANAREPQTGGTVANNAPPSSQTNAVFRLANGAQDTNNNAADFAVGWPSPRNLATALNNGLSLIGSASPYLLEPGASARLVCQPFTATGGIAPVGAGTTITVDASLIGAGVVPLLDDGLGADDIANDGYFTASVTVGGAIAAGSYSLPVTCSSGSSSGGAYLSVLVNPSSTPDNDNCVGAQLLSGSFPLVVAGNLTGATTEFNGTQTSPVAPTAGIGSKRGMWYRVVGTGNTLTADLCASAAFDSVMLVFGGTCENMTQVAANDQSTCPASANLSACSWCSVAGADYYIFVAPFASGAVTNAFTLTVSNGSTPCTGATPLSVCTPASLGLATLDENEPDFGPANSDGCDSTPGLFVPITAGPAPLVVGGRARGYGGNRDVDWYRFQATTSDTLFVTLTGQAQSLFEIRGLSATGTCSTATLLAQSAISDRCTPIAAAYPLTAGSWYAVRVLEVGAKPSGVFGGVFPGSYNDAYRLTVQLGGVPPNDNCADAALFSQGGVLVGSTVGATNDGNSPCDPSGRDVWYRLVTSAPGTLAIDTSGSSIDTAIAVYSACGGSEIACNDDCAGCQGSGTFSCLTLLSLPAGEYRIRVSDKGIGTGGWFLIRNSLDVVGNDTCCDATLISVPSVTAGTTVGATAESPAPPACAGPLPGGSQSFTYTNGVWYRVVSPIDQTITADTLASAYDSKMWVFNSSAGCTSLTCVTANDDAQSSPFQSKVAWRAQAGVEYRILVAPFSTTTGSFTLTLVGDPTPVNDDCANATVISGNSGSIAGTTIGATAINNTSTAANPSCNPSYSMFEVWYQYTAPCTTNLTLGTCGAFDTVLSVHTLCSTLTTSNQVAGACNDNGTGSCSPGSSLVVAVTGGTTYRIRVASAISALPNGNFTLTWALQDTDLDGTADCSDGCPNDPLKIAPGQCGCGVPDTDTDGDGTANCIDGCPNDPLKIAPGICGCNVPDTDSDGDGTPNCVDGCPTDPNKIAPGICGCNVPDTDSDGDGTANCIDGCPNDPFKIAPGICGCGFPDSDSDGDGAADCIDGCPNDPNKIVPGICGCNVPDTDSDGDGTANCLDGCPNDPLKIAPGVCGCGVLDTDSDGDGAADCVDGCPSDPAKTSPGLCGCGVSDTDSDGDGILDCFDNCPSIANATQDDLDADGAGDVCDNCVTIFNPGQADCDLDGVGDVCALLLGAPDCNLNFVPDSCDISSGSSTDANVNGIPDDCETNGGTPYCFGDGSANGGPDCPCFNNVPVGAHAGCQNSTGLGGRMYGGGQTSVSSDQLVLTTTDLPPNVTSVLVQGNVAQAGGFGTHLYAGLLCVNSNLRRLGVRNSGPSGVIIVPSGADLPISVMGQVPAIGGARFYQNLYRNLTGPCGFGSNGSNGVSVVWVP